MISDDIKPYIILGSHCLGEVVKAYLEAFAGNTQASLIMIA